MPIKAKIYVHLLSYNIFPGTSNTQVIHFNDLYIVDRMIRGLIDYYSSIPLVAIIIDEIRVAARFNTAWKHFCFPSLSPISLDITG